MKTTSFKKIAFLICAACSTFALPQANAATFKLETLVPGYTGYVLVKPELRSVLGGKVRWNSSIGGYETDRVQRGEKIRFTISPSTSAERCRSLAVAGISSSNGCYSYGIINLPYVNNQWSVTQNAAFDNIRVTVYSSAGVFDFRMPIGKR